MNFLSGTSYKTIKNRINTSKNLVRSEILQQTYYGQIPMRFKRL